MEIDEVRIGDIVEGSSGNLFRVINCENSVSFIGLKDDAFGRRMAYTLDKTLFQKHYLNIQAIHRRKLELWKKMKSE